MKKNTFLIRCKPQEMKLIQQGAADLHYSVNVFMVQASMIFAKLATSSDAEVLVSEQMSNYAKLLVHGMAVGLKKAAKSV